MMYAFQKIDPPFCGISGIFSPTSKYSVFGDVNVMYAPSYYVPPFCDNSGIISPTS